nr:CHAT domain-containing protein [Pseudonocardia acidicola]
MELRALASGHGVELGHLGLQVLLRSGSPLRVLDWTERTRAAALLTAAPPAPEAVQEERAALAAVYAELAEARRETGAEPAELLARQTAIEARIRRATWHGRVPEAAPGARRPAHEIRALLDGGALVSFTRAGDDLVAVVLDGRRSTLVALGPLAPLHFEADALLFALRRLTRRGPGPALHSARVSAEHALARLSETLVRPLGVDPDAPLVVVPTADTHRIPWSALHQGPVVVAPSASVWAETRIRATARRQQRVVLVAGPGLPGAEHEVAAVADCYPAPAVLVPPDATVSATADALAAADLAHLACHGHLRTDNPTFSALALADGLLTVHELDLRGIAPHRIVLAACDSAADVSYAGDELLGFAAALLARGTAGLVASVVAVGDREAVGLMRALHERLAAGRGMAEALHAARATVDRADPRGFVNWCSFTAYGAG